MPGVTYYTNCATLIAGCIIYTDSAFTSPVPSGYYSDGTNCYFVGGHPVPGAITSISSCTPT